MARARSTSGASSTASGLTGSVPVLMRATSSRLSISSRMLSDCSTMMRRNWRSSAGSRSSAASIIVVAEPRIVVSGVRSSWLTMPRNSARSRSMSSSADMSWNTNTYDSISPPAARTGAAFSSTVTLRPSGTPSTISSARTVSPVASPSASGSSASDTSRPSARRMVSTSSSCSGGWSAPRMLSMTRRASRFTVIGRAVRASSTATPTGEVSISVSRPVRARCSSRRCPALSSAIAACDANITRVSSSSRVNSGPGRSRARWMLPSRSPRRRMGAVTKAPIGAGGLKDGRPISAE